MCVLTQRGLVHKDGRSNCTDSFFLHRISGIDRMTKKLPSLFVFLLIFHSNLQKESKESVMRWNRLFFCDGRDHGLMTGALLFPQRIDMYEHLFQKLLNQ